MKVYHISENGFSITDNKVSIPECNVKADGYLEAVDKLNNFLRTRSLTSDIELITPFDRIDFD